jgi:hypothetical protein
MSMKLGLWLHSYSLVECLTLGIIWQTVSAKVAIEKTVSWPKRLGVHLPRTSELASAGVRDLLGIRLALWGSGGFARK